MSTPGSNGPAIVNGGDNDYDRTVAFDAPVAMDSGLYVDPGLKTLAQLREMLMVRLGYAAMLASPPPGMKEELNSFLEDAQAQLYVRYSTFRIERWWTWLLQPGQRFYDVPVDGVTALNFRKISWAGIDDNGRWTPLIAGIDPVLYNGPQTGLPSHYELRDAIEVWPAPDTAATLRLKGHLGLKRFTEDTDTPTIDTHAVFLFALALAKAHRGQPDAANYARMAERYIGGLVAGEHGTRRYIPRPSTLGMKDGGDERVPPLPGATWR